MLEKVSHFLHCFELIGNTGSDQCKAGHGFVGGQRVAQPAQKLSLAQSSIVWKEKPCCANYWNSPASS